MSKNLINSAGDFLHLYLGCQADTPDGVGKLISVSTFNHVTVTLDGDKYFEPKDVKPILRKIETMTEEEQREIGMDAMEVKHAISQKRNPAFYTKEFIYLLKNSFDIFGLIETGFAIDSTERVGVN